MRGSLLTIAAAAVGLSQPARGDGVPDLVITLDAPELAAADASSEFPVVTVRPLPPPRPPRRLALADAAAARGRMV